MWRQVYVDRAVTVGYEMNLSLKTPCEVFEANAGFKREVTVNNSQVSPYKKLSYCWETVRRETMLRIAEMDVGMTT